MREMPQAGAIKLLPISSQSIIASAIQHFAIQEEPI
jgi:hypothetical protein